MCNSTLLSPTEWASHEFAQVPLGDARLRQRLVIIAAGLAAQPAGTLPQACANWAELKAAYRFFDHPTVDFPTVAQPPQERTRQACRAPGEYLLIEDSTDLDFSGHRRATDLGVIGDGQGRGFTLHTTLAVRVEGWSQAERPAGQVVGLFAQQCRRPVPAPPGESRRERLSRPRKSGWWAEVFQEVEPPPPGCQWIYVADRESDFCEPIQRCQTRGVGFIIRSCHDRRLAEVDGHLCAALASAPVLGTSTVALRSRGGEPARTATVELRAVPVDLAGPWRPGGWQLALRGVWAVEVREVGAPATVTAPLHWVLLTSLPCRTLAGTRRVVGCYAAWWWVEEYHKALKSGTGVEHSQLATGGRLEPLIAVLAVVAVRLLSTKLLARGQPEGTEALTNFGPEALALLERKFGCPAAGWNNRTVLVATARLGGFLVRKAAVRNKSSISNFATMPLRPLPTHLDATFIHYRRLKATACSGGRPSGAAGNG